MVTDQQVRRLMKLIQTEPTLVQAAAKAGMSDNTARKYHRAGQLPSALRPAHTWRSREDPFADVWVELVGFLEGNPGLESKTLFEYLQRQHPGQFPDGQLRTLQRKVKRWRALDGPAQEVFFPQIHLPGRLAESDFCSLTPLGITLAGEAFPHLLYHFVLTYSNWETGRICFSESFESLSEGLQHALWELGGVPERHRTDRLGAAVAIGGEEPFLKRYQTLLDHYGLSGERIQAGRANENGDCEQRHRRFRTAVDQALMLRGSRDFESRTAYEAFLRKLFAQVNAGRRERLAEERARLRTLPTTALEACKRMTVRVGPSSTIRVANNTYSVHSRLIREWVEVKLFSERLEVWYAQQRIETLPRLRGRNQAHIEYRHVIDALVKKPGAFAHYRFREELFPSVTFRQAYDYLCDRRPQQADREYLELLRLAAKESETAVEAALRQGLRERRLSIERVTASVKAPPAAVVPAVEVARVDLSRYDTLLSPTGGASWH